MMSELQISKSTNQQLGRAREYLAGLKKCLDKLSLKQIAEVISYLEEAYQEGRQVFIIGNGGSAATASHMACDLGKVISPPEDTAAQTFQGYVSDGQHTLDHSAGK